MVQKGRVILLIGLLLCLSLGSISELAAQFRSPVEHLITISADGGGAALLMGSGVDDRLDAKMGGTGSMAVHYELQKGNFFFNIGVGANVINTGFYLENYTDQFERVDKDEEAIYYRYQYSDYKERQTSLALLVPVQAGGYIHDFYLAATARLLLRASRWENVNTQMYTEGEYIRFFAPIQLVESYGYYPEMTYAQKQNTGSFGQHIDLMVGGELGYRVLNTPKIMMRVGLFAEYGVLTQNQKKGYTLADYSKVDLNPQTQNLQNLRATLRFNSLNSTALVGKERLNNLLFGARITLGFKLKRSSSYPCRCVEDW